MIILQEAINTFSFSPHIDKESPADKPVTCLRDFFRQNRTRAASRLKPRGFCLSTWMNPADTSELMWWEIVAGDRPMRSARSCPQRDSFFDELDDILRGSVPKTSATTACFGLSSPRGHLLNSTPTRISLLLPTSSMDDPARSWATAPRRNSLQPFLMLSTQPDGCDILAPRTEPAAPSAAEAIYHGVSKLLLQFAPL